MFAITRNGLEPAKSKDLTEGRVYLFGASSSPKKAFTVSVTGGLVTYVDLQYCRHHRPRLTREQHPILSDLVSRAEKTAPHKKEQYVSQHGDLKGMKLWKAHLGQYIDGGPLSKTLQDVVDGARENGLANT
jgi:hypothetical protein